MPLYLLNVKDVVHASEYIWRIAREAIKRKEILRIPPCRGYFLRKEDANIRNKLKILCQRRNLSCVKTLVLHGPPGYGKQFSAANLMNQLYTASISNSLSLRTSQTKPRFVKPTIKWTVNATNTKTLLESYCSLANELGLRDEVKAAKWMLPLHSRTLEGRQYHMHLHDHCQTDAYEEALKQIYEDVMKKLSVQHSWVLLIDGPTKNVAILDNFWPQAGDRRFGNGLVILTSESPLLQIKEGCVSSQEKVYIGKMTDSDAVKFLENKSGISATGSDRMYAKDVAVNILKNSPQDIAKFGSFVRKYVDRTNEKLTFRELAGTETATPSECMLLLEMTCKSQAKILYFLACCSHGDFLPLQILESYFSEATEAVTQSEFVEISERDGMKMVTIHKRYHDALRDILCRQEEKPCEDTWTGFYSRIVKHLGRNKTDSPLKRPTLSPHDVSKVIKCLSRICKTALQRNSDEDFIMLRFILPHLKECVQLSKTLKVEDVEPLVTADGYACLGESLLFFGESEEARKNLEVALARYKNYRGPENVQLDVANVLHFLGEAYSNSYLGDPKIGEQYLREALKEKEQFYVNDEGHPQIAFTLRSLGNVLNEVGKQIEAIEKITRALRIYEDAVKDVTIKQEYGYTLSALGSSYRYLGRYWEAEGYLKKALRTFGTVDSPSKLRMGVTLSRLASVQRNLDKLDESIKSLQEAEEMLGYNDIYKAVILSKLSVVYRYKGDSNNSLHFAEEASRIIDQKYDYERHPAIATAMLNLGHAQSDVWIVDEAEKNLTKALKPYEALHGENHRIVAATLNYLSYAYQQSGRVQEGKELVERAVEIMDKNYAPSHPGKANSLKRLSKACGILGETIRSADLANSALQIYKETHGNTMAHRDVRKCAVRVAYACSKVGLFKWAEECLKEVQLGFPHDKKNHPEFAAFLQKKTEIILDKLEINMIKWPSDDKTIQKIMSRAKVDLLTAEEILKTSPGCNDRQHSVLQKEQARLNIVLGNYEDAYQQICLALEKTRHLSQKIPNSAHYLKAEFSLVRSDVEGKLSLMNGQKESLKTAEAVYRNAFGNNHPMLSLTLQKLSARYFDLGCQKEAEKCLEESEKICSVLRKDLQKQLNCCTSEFLVNYNLGTHPILKRQERNQGAW